MKVGNIFVTCVISLLLMYVFISVLRMYSSDVACVIQSYYSQGESSMNEIEKPQEAVNKCIKDDGKITSNNYHLYMLGKYILACYENDFKHEDIQAVFKNIPCEWI